MSDNNTTAKISIGLPWISVAIGGINGWVVTGEAHGLIIGCLCGILISFITYFGLIPIGGVIIYHWIVGALFSWIGIDLAILYWYGLICALIYTAITTFVVLMVIIGVVRD